MGTFTGASALWYADSLSSLGLDTQIYTVDDIDPALVSEETKQKMPDNVKLIEGDYNKIADISTDYAAVFTTPLVGDRGWPQLLRDCHGILNDYMIIGDYLVVEDIDPRIPAQLGIYSMDEEIETWGTENTGKNQYICVCERHSVY